MLINLANLTNTAPNKTVFRTVTYKAKMELKSENEEKEDCIEISNIRATSGKEELVIKQGATSESFVINFGTDMYTVYRAIERGYISVNGQEIYFSEEEKAQLKITADAAEKQNQIARSLAEAQQTANAMMQEASAFQKAGKAYMELLRIYSRVAKGAKVSQADLQKLLQGDPQLYAMAMAARAMAKQKDEVESEIEFSDCEETDDDALEEETSTDTPMKNISTVGTQMVVTTGETSNISCISVGDFSSGGL